MPVVVLGHILGAAAGRAATARVVVVDAAVAEVSDRGRVIVDVVGSPRSSNGRS